MKTYDTILEAMQQRYRELSGLEADDASDIGIRLKVLAQQVFDLYRRMVEVQKQVFPQTSSGQYLEMHGETRGIVRKKALPAAGVLRFSRQAPAISDIPIAKGIICATRSDPQVQFATTCEGVLPAGETQVDIPAEALDGGAQGNVAAKSICLMVTPAPGISSAENRDAFAGGVDEEKDDALRERLLMSYRNISNGTNCAFYYDLASSQEGVKSVNVLPRNRGRGTVDVVISCASPAKEKDMVQRLQEEMGRRKEINVDVQVAAAVRDVVDVEVEISIPDGYDPEAVLQGCRERIRRFAENLGVGKPLLLAQLGSAVFEVDGVYNYSILSPGKDVLPRSEHVVAVGEISAVRMAVG